MQRKKHTLSSRSKQPRKKLLLETCEDRILCASSGDLQVVVEAAPNFVVDSNLQAGPHAATLIAKVTNTGADPLTNVSLFMGNYVDGTNDTPGVYPTTAGAGALNGNFSLTQEGGVDDATRIIGTIAPGETVTQYWLVSYPWTDGDGTPVFQAQADPSDDLVLNYDVWAKATDPVAGSLTAVENKNVTLRSEISAMANKIWPNTTSKVPEEYLNAFQEQLGWSPQSAPPGVSLQQGIWYDLGRVNLGYDADGNLVPDYDVFMQPVGDPSVFNADAHRLVNSYGVLIVKLNDGTEQIIAFEDRLYFKDLPANNTGVVGLVYYEYAQIGSGSSTLSPYQEAASGSNNEKFNGDYGATSGSVMLAENPPLFDKTGPATVVLGNTINYTLTTTAPATNSFGLPQYGLPVVISDEIPVGTTYVAGSASSGISLPAGNTATVFYSTDGGLSWTTTEPASNLVTNLQWRLSADLDPNQVATVTFSTFVPLNYAQPIVDNDAGVGIGGPPILRDEVITLVTGVQTISGVVFRDEGGGTGTAADGVINGTESGLGAVSVSLYLDMNNDGEVGPGDVLRATTNSISGTGAYSFTNLVNGNYLVVADREDTDKPFGWQMSTTDTRDVTIANANVTDQNFGFAPVVDVEKNLVGSNPVYEGDLVTFTIDTTNLLGGFGGSTIPAAQDVWLSASAAGTDFTNSANALGAPNGIFSSGTSATNNNNLNLITPVGFVAQNSIVGVKVLLKVQIAGALSNDTLVIDLIQQGVSRGTISLTGADLNGLVNSAGLIVVDVSGRANWVAADFTAANTGLSATFTRAGGDDGATLFVDGLGFRVETAVIDPSAGGLFYSDIATNIITRTTSNGTNPLTILSALGDDPSDIAYDPVTKKIYWSVTTGGFIRRANLDGTGIETIVTGGGTITGLDIDSVSRTIYWADSAGDRIVRANLDGTAQTVILSAIGTPQALALDVGAGKLYFGASQSNSMRRANLDGTGLETLITNQDVGFNFNFPEDIEVDATNGRIYWTDSIGRYVARAQTTGTTAQIIASAATIATGINGVMGLDIDVPAGFVFWADDTANVITRANLDGSNEQTMITGLTTPREVELAGSSASIGTGTFGINTTISTLTLTDDYDPTRFTFVSASQNPSSVDTGTGLITWNNIGPLNGGVTERITVTFRVLEPVENVQQLNVQNVAAITTAIMANGSPTNLDTDTATVTVNPTANIGDLIWNNTDGDAVQDAGEGGITGVQVQLVSGTLVIATTTTDANGAYLFTGVRDGSYIVRIVQSTLPTGMTANFDPDGGTAHESTVTIAGAANNLTRDFGYGGRFLLSGTIWNDYDRDAVRDLVEPSLTGATVALTVGGVSQGTATLDASGGYLFSIPTATAAAGAAYVITVTTPAGTWTQTVDPNGAPLTNPFSSNLGNPLTSNTLINQNFAFYLTGTGSIGDEVFYDWDQDNVKDATDEGIPNITATLYADLNGNGVFEPAIDAPMLTTSTNAAGNYTFANLAAGNYLVLVDTDDAQFPTNTTPSSVNPRAVTLGVGVNNTTTDFGYYKAGIGEITGVVWYDKNGNQVQVGSDEIGLANITVTLQVDLNGDGTYVSVATTSSGADGSYSFSDLPFGNFRVVVDDADIDLPEDTYGITYDPTTVTSRDVALTSLAPTATANYGFGQLGSIGDTVFYDANRNGTQDYNETGIANVTLQLRNNLNVVIATTMTNASGFYLLTGVAPGTYAVQVDTTTLPVGITGVDLIADPDRDGVPSWDNTYPSLPPADQRDDSIIVNFGVSYRGADFGYEPQGVVGDYIFRDLDADGVQDAGEIGISGVAVSITNGALTFNTTSDSDGLYFFQNLSNGTWTVTVTPPAGHAVTGGIDANLLAGIGSAGVNTATLTMTGGDLTAVNGTAITEGNQKIDFGYRLNGANTLAGTVVLEQQGVTDGNAGEATDTAVPNMGVFLYDNSNNLFGSVLTAATGAYSFSNLPNGTFRVSMSASGVLLQNTELTTVTGNTPATSVTDNGTSAFQTLTLGGSVAGVDFAWVSTVDYDFGDLPAGYGTLIVNDGARHILSGAPALYLGTTPPDIELNGQPNATATGDGADESGISVVSPAAWLEGANGGTLRAVVNGSGWLVGWMDFNNDGDFLDTNEMVMDQAVTTGAANYSFTVPVGALGGGGGVDIYSRFRLFEAAPPISLLSYVGSVTGGEVEDYRLTVGVETLGSISGTVYRDLNNDGTQLGAGETGIQTVTITITGTDDLGAAVSVNTTTDASGNYSFTNLRPSNATGYSITETQPAGFLDGLNTAGTSGGTAGNPPPGDAITSIFLTGGTDATGYNFGELPPSSLAGTVYRDNNNSGAIDGGETGIDGVTVTLTGTNDLGVAVNVSTTTAGGGLYSFANLRPSNGTGYTLTETQPGTFLDGKDTAGTAGGSAAAVPDDAISSIVLASNTTGTAYIFGELNPASLSGSVYGDLDNDGVFDAFESGIPGATVTLTGTNDLGAIAPIVATTSATGAYSFTNLRPGTYTITETQPSGYADGADTLGAGLSAPNNAGSAAVSDVFSSIVFSTVITGNNTGVNYNFGESPNFGLTKSLQTTNVAATTGSSVTLGEIATFRLVATIPAGSFTNFQLQDALPAGYQFINGSALVSLVSSAGQLTSSTLSGAGLAQTSVGTPTFAMPDTAVSDNSASNSDTYNSGTDVYFQLGNLTNTDTSGATTESVVIEFQARVVNEVGNQAGTNLDNTFSVIFDKDGGSGTPDPHGPPSNTITSTVAEPNVTISKVANPTSNVDAGDVITYTVTLTNPGGANSSTAFDTLLVDTMPSHLLVTGITSTTLNGGATADSAAAIGGGGTSITGQYDIPAGGSVVIVYTATVQTTFPPNGSLTNAAVLTWTSLNGGNSTAPDANERFGAAGSTFGDGSLNDYRRPTSATTTGAGPTFSKVLFSTSDAGTTGSNVGIGETVTYGLLVTLPEGTTSGFNVLDVLPAGLQYTSSSIVTTAAASNGFLTANFNGTVPAPTVTGGATDGDDVFFTFSNIVANADGVSGNNTFLLLVSARVTDVAGNSGSPQTTLPNVATFDDPNDPPTPFTPPPVTVDVVESVLEIAKDFNVTQADAGDTVQISIVVNNTGNGPAYDVVVDDAVNLAKFGSITAVTTPAGFTFNNVAGNVSYTGGTIAAGESATFVFSVKLTDAVNPSEVLSNTASATATSQPGVVAGERTFGPVSDDATLNVPAVFTLTKGITSPTGGTVKIGDLVTYSVDVTLLEGTTNNISLTDLLPAGMTYLNGSAVVSNANGMTVNGFAANAIGNTLSISATRVVNPGNVDNTATADSATFTITYQAVVDDVAGNVSGTLLTNSLTGGGDGTPPSTPPPVTTTVTEPQLQISKLVDDATANIGQTLHFTLTIQNLNVVNSADAYDLLVRDALPAGLAGLANIVVNGATVDANNSTGSLLDLKLSQLALGATATITFDATVDTNTALVGTNIDNNERLYWDSQPGESDNSVLTGTPDSDGDRDYGATGADEVFDATTDPAQDTERVSVNANTISGVIYQDVNENGIFNLGTDTGLGGQTVTLTGNLAAGGAAFTLTTTTDGNGNYTFNNVPAGTYVITETQPAGYVDGAETAGTPFGGVVSPTLGSNTISSIVLPGGSNAGTGYNFGEVLTSTFAGSVYEDVNDDGVRGIERGIGGVTITLTGTDFLGQSVTFTTTTNITGDFNFDGGVNGLRPGTYTITETTQPAGYPDGKDTSGTPSGTVTNDVISNITIAQNTTASGYLFGELFPFDPVKSIVSTSNVGTTGNNVTIGETVRYRLVVALPGGLLNDYVIADNLPSGMSFLDDGTASLAFVSSNGALISSSTLGTAAGATDSNATPSFTLPATAISNSANSDTDGWSNGTDVFFRLGNLTNTDDVGRQYVIVEFNAQVLNVSANQQGRTLANTFAPRFDLTGDGTNDPLPANVISNTVRTPVVEPILSLDKKITSGPAQPKPGDTITFTVNIGHAAGSGATAWETLFTDTLPAGLQFVSVSTQASGGAVVTKAATFDGSGHVTGLFDIPVGGKITITYQVKVAANVKSGATLVNGADIQWTSAPGDDINERKSGDSLLNKGGLNDYELKAQAQLTVSNPPPPTPFQYFYDRFNKWHRKELDRTLPLGGLYVVESPDNYRPPILPLAPIYSGEADPGSTLVLTLTNANGETIGTQMVVVDAGGNWMATFPTTTIRDFPNSVRIDQINAFYSLSDSPGHNLRAYYSPALSSGHFFFEELRTITQDTEAPLLSGLAIENPLGEGTTKYGGEMLSTQGVAGGY